MTVLTPDQIGVLIYENKRWGPGSGKDAVVKFLDTAIAVALAESGGNTQAKNPSSSASGLYQIMVSAHGDKIAGRDIFDPRVNVDVARLVWNAAGKSWSPWKTYTNGAYKAHLGHGAAVYDTLYKAVSSGDKSTLVKIVDNIPIIGSWANIFGVDDNVAGAVKKVTKTPAEIVGDSLKATFDWLREAALVVGIFILAVGLLILGVLLLMSRTKAGKLAIDAGEMAVSGGATKVAKGVASASQKVPVE